MKPALTPEDLVPRLGDYLIRKGLITDRDLKIALNYQKEKQSTGERMLLGQAIIEKNLLTRQEIDNAVTEQIIQLRSALEEANRFLEQRVEERTAELQDAIQKLAELSQLKANFVANISHELRTPLTHVKGYLDLLSNESLGPISAGQSKALQVSQRSVGKLESLIDNLILFSLAARGEMTVNMIPVDINKIAIKIINYSQLKAVDRNVDLIFADQPDLPFVQADSEKISWVILQLIDNAIKFTPEGGTVTLSIKLESDSLVMVSITDTGIGIPVNRLSELFEPFHQLDSSSTRRFGGTGLGLALVRDIISAHGSLIEVHSEVGKGTRFCFPLIVGNKSS